jgi:site-specific DNA-methyltransferase (adenine-specific)
MSTSIGSSGLEDGGFEILGQVDWLYATGWAKGQNLKPCHEPVVVARKPFKGTRAANVRKRGVGAFFADRCRTPRAGADGRWPGDVLLTHAPNCRRLGEREVSTNGYWADTKVTGYGKTYEYSGTGERPKGTVVADWECTPDCPYHVLSDYGCGANKKTASETAGDYYLNTSWELEQTANRELLAKDCDGLPIEAVLVGEDPSFFFAAKPATREKSAGLEHRDDVLVRRSGGAKTAAARGQTYDGKGGFNRVVARKNTHPTVKPIAIMSWLLKLVIPEGGVVIDPFCGSGTTGCAVAVQNNDPEFAPGWKFIGIEADFESQGFHEQAAARIRHWANDAESVELLVHPSGPACQDEHRREVLAKKRLKAARAAARKTKESARTAQKLRSEAPR